MLSFELPVAVPFQYVMTGKFQSPDPDWIHMARRMEDFELMVVTEGTLYLALDDQEYTVGEKEFLLCPPGVEQQGWRASACSFYWVHFMPQGVELPVKAAPLCTERDPGRIWVPVFGRTPSLEKIVVMMKQFQDGVRSYRDPTFNNYFVTAILCEFYNQILTENRQVDTSTHRQQLYNDIIDFIRWNQNANLKVMDIAEHFGYNPKYLSHLFNALTGQSLKQYILQDKMERARFLLADTNESIARISETLGFNDSHNFMKLFKKHVGLTPTEYRNAYNKRLLYYV